MRSTLFRSAFTYTIIAFLSAMVSSSCNRALPEVTGPLDTALESARKQGKFLFVVTSNGDCGVCNQYISSITNSKKFKNALARKDFLFHRCAREIDENSYLFYSTHCAASPTTYIFDPEGVLINFSVGSQSIDAALGMIDASSKRIVLSDSIYSRLNLGAESYIKYVNTTLNFRRLFSNSDSDDFDVKHAIDQLIESNIFNPNFYHSYLIAMASLQLGELEIAEQHAMAALNESDTYSLLLYGDLRNELMETFSQFGDNGHGAAGALEFPVSRIELELLRSGTRNPSFFKYVNSGPDEVSILHVLGSCSCLQFDYDKKPIKQGESGNIRAVFHADRTGDFERIIIVQTTDKQNPVKRLVISGTVQ